MVQSATTTRSIYLEAGNSYFLEALAKINNKGEELNVFWSYPIPSLAGNPDDMMMSEDEAVCVCFLPPPVVKTGWPMKTSGTSSEYRASTRFPQQGRAP